MFVWLVVVVVVFTLSHFRLHEIKITVLIIHLPKSWYCPSNLNFMDSLLQSNMPIQFCQLQMHRDFRKEDCIVSASTDISVIRIMLCDSYPRAAGSSYFCSQAWRWSTWVFWEKKAYFTKYVNNDFCSYVLKKLCNWISFMGSFWVGVKGNTENSCDEDKPLGQVLYEGQNCDIDLQIHTC